MKSCTTTIVLCRQNFEQHNYHELWLRSCSLSEVSAAVLSFIFFILFKVGVFRGRQSSCFAIGTFVKSPVTSAGTPHSHMDISGALSLLVEHTLSEWVCSEQHSASIVTAHHDPTPQQSATKLALPVLVQLDQLECSTVLRRCSHSLSSGLEPASTRNGR
jgi:hypothetical protein